VLGSEIAERGRKQTELPIDPIALLNERVWFESELKQTAKQVGQVENFLAQGMDAVVILPVDTTATGPMTKNIVKAGKPLVYVNRKPEKLPKGVVYVGSKSIDAGVMNMEELGKAMGGKGNLAILIGELSDEPAHGRTDGIKQVVKE
jgi:inositol transport system substrate-binding protein